MPQPRRKEIRLHSDVYRTEGQVFSVTIGTSPRLPIFENLDFGLGCIRILQDLRSETDNPIYAYCLMPDHVHLLVGITRGAALGGFVGPWKSLCYQARCRMGNRDAFWQRSYFDHALRSDEDLRAAALYILLNPVRKGLVKDFRSYPLCGSLEWDVRTWCSPAI
jgi:REP element-mobilizing transposase RayT